MHPEAAFLAGYAFVLTLVSLGVESLGRRSSDPWASPTLAASKTRTERQRGDGQGWPHTEVATFHIGLSAVALAAALVITTVSIVRHSRAVELATHAGLLGVIAARVRHLVHRRRTVAGGG